MPETRDAHGDETSQVSGARTGRTPHVPAIAIFSLAVFACYATYAVALHNTFRTGAFDLGIFDQAVRDYARFRSPVSPIRAEGLVLIGDHFHPILAILAPLYWIWDDPRMLVVAQAALVSASIPVVHRFASRRLQHWSAWCVTFGYALGWPVQHLVHFDFHEVAFAVPLLALAIDALDRRADRVLVVACLALLLVREDMGVLVAVIGVLRAWSRPRLTGVGLTLTGLAAFVLVTKVVMARLAPAGEWVYWSYEALGDDVQSAILAVLTRPWDALGLLVSPPVKRLTLLALFVPLVFTPLVSRYLLVTLPLLAAQLFTSREELWVPGFHYWAPLWTVLVLAAVDGLARLRRWHRLWVPGAPLALAAGTCLGLALLPVLYPVHRLATGGVFEEDPHLEHQRGIVAAIPASTCVEADNHLVPHLVSSNLVSVPGRLVSTNPDLIALDMSRREVHFDGPTPLEASRDALADGYVEVWRRGDLVLYRAPDYRGPTPACAP